MSFAKNRTRKINIYLNALKELYDSFGTSMYMSQTVKQTKCVCYFALRKSFYEPDIPYTSGWIIFDDIDLSYYDQASFLDNPVNNSSHRHFVFRTFHSIHLADLMLHYLCIWWSLNIWFFFYILIVPISRWFVYLWFVCVTILF